MSDFREIIKLRHTLHRYPELSNLEFETSKRISDFMQQFNPDEELDISDTGKAFVFDSGEPGPIVVFRAELDALPILEQTNLAYESLNTYVAHLCGHDGHMAILVALSKLIAENKPEKGKAVILFQPAEENELGAKDVVESMAFRELDPDYVFALHNIPGVPKNKVLLKEGSFSAASKGMTVRLEGLTSHAAEPEKGISPVMAISDIINALNELIRDSGQFNDTTFTTVIYIRMGEVAFGVSPSHAELGITLRAFENGDMELLTLKTEKIVELIAHTNQLTYDINYSEIYPATINDIECVSMIREAAERSGLETEQMEKPNRWSEDFAYFTATYKGAQFGFGAGEKQPPLHNPEYDFPDDIIEPAAHVFFEIYKDKLVG
ncbi:MAG: amidohydrolase [Balneolaceae bacterium]|nr:amidohydrolase [Balneolaceae bacterium]